MADGQRHQHPPQRLLLGGSQVFQQFQPVGGDSPPGGVDGTAGQVLLGEREQTRLVGQQTGFQEVAGAHLAQRLDVEGPAGGQRVEAFPELAGAAAGVRAAQVLVALLLLRQGGSAGRAVGGHHEFAFVAVAQRDDGGDDLGNHVTGLAEHHRVPDPHSLAHHLVGVVEGGHGDRGSRDRHRFHRPERGDAPGAPDPDTDVEEPGVNLLGWVLVGDRPARRPGCGSQPALDGQVVDLDHDPVDLVFGVVAVFAVVGDVGPGRGGRVDHPGVGRYRQPVGAQHLVGLALAGQGEAVVGSDAVDDHPQGPGGGDPGVFLPERPGGGVAGVGEPVLPGLLQGLVQLREGLFGEEHLASHLQHGGNVASSQPVRDAVDGGDVSGDVLPHPSVPPGGSLREAPVEIGEVHRQPVDLQFAQVVLGGHPGQPGGQFGLVENVV